MSGDAASIVLGIITSPSAATRRDAARLTWLRDSSIISGDVAYRFVIGESASSCAGASTDLAAADIVRVQAPDCAKWHGAAKVHAWFKLALKVFPRAQWFGKTEDDGMLWPSALHADLKALEQRSPRAQYYGVLSWQGSCPAGESYYGSKRTDADITCAGCYGGAVSDGGALCRATRCDNGPPPNHRRCCQVGCPRSLRMVPFAIGALDVRKRDLAEAVATCSYADAYFHRVSSYSAALNAMCQTVDGAQGHAIGECVDSVRIADITSQRLADSTQCRNSNSNGRCEDGVAVVVHPLKRFDALSWNRTWADLTRSSSSSSSSTGGRGAIIEAHLDSLGRSSKPLSRAPRLQLISEYRVPISPDLHPSPEWMNNDNSGESLASRWKKRQEYLDSVTRAHESRFSGQARVGRRLRSEPLLYLLNCSRVWSGESGNSKGHGAAQSGTNAAVRQ